ncbi:TetR/AcrR family transcriptional regulator [Myxococcus sp. SDU36]|uniref:TetR/AcrR family transcriptional regulator n=1 Tax=Myxococcus sp. SDU36 TaxID=2831967 RepID=UPI002543F424|nr:TetR/AcrR family transcriptional regulator [Myxococcus sp. SDU36]WIG92963.1 TetR/AcrR family transcriptional regulator [Myxococcus sp. SDU36]
MAGTRREERDALRRAAILDAALECFLRFGYAKTSLDDIAKRANLSRPLLYLKFKNKEDIFAAVFESLFEARYPRVEQVLAGPGSARDKLLQVYEIILLEPWALMVGAPMASEFYAACERLLPEVEARRRRRWLKYTQAVLKPRPLAEVFMLAVDGLLADVPTTRVLRQRLALLVERFTA